MPMPPISQTNHPLAFESIDRKYKKKWHKTKNTNRIKSNAKCFFSSYELSKHRRTHKNKTIDSIHMSRMHHNFNFVFNGAPAIWIVVPICELKKNVHKHKKKSRLFTEKKDKNINATCIRYVHRREHGKNVNKGTHTHITMLCCCHRSTFIQRDRNRIEYVRWTWISMTHFVRSAVCVRVTPPLPPHCRWMLFFFLLFESTDWNWSRK